MSRHTRTVTVAELGRLEHLVGLSIEISPVVINDNPQIAIRRLVFASVSRGKREHEILIAQHRITNEDEVGTRRQTDLSLLRVRREARGRLCARRDLSK